MFTNGISVEIIKQLDGILDEIIFSYRGNYSLHNQKNWKTPLSLQVLVTQTSFRTLETLKEFIIEKKKTGMPNHLKYSMSPEGEIRSFYFLIIKNHEKCIKSIEKVILLI